MIITSSPARKAAYLIFLIRTGVGPSPAWAVLHFLDAAPSFRIAGEDTVREYFNFPGEYEYEDDENDEADNRLDDHRHLKVSSFHDAIPRQHWPFFFPSQLLSVESEGLSFMQEQPSAQIIMGKSLLHDPPSDDAQTPP